MTCRGQGIEGLSIKVGVYTGVGGEGWRRQCKGWWTRRYREIAADTDWSETSDQGRRTHSVGEIKSQVTAVTK